MTPEQRIIDALYDSDRSHMSGVTVGDLIECDSCGEQFPHWARWLNHRTHVAAADVLNAVGAALTSDDPAVVRAMAERMGLRVEIVKWVDEWSTPGADDNVTTRRYRLGRVLGPWQEVSDADA